MASCFDHYCYHEHHHPRPHHVDLCVPYDDTRIWKALEDLEDVADELHAFEDHMHNFIDSLLNKIYTPSEADGDYVASGNPAGYLDENGTVHWKTNTSVPVGDLNLWAANESPANVDTANAIRSRNISENDLKVV